MPIGIIEIKSTVPRKLTNSPQLFKNVNWRAPSSKYQIAKAKRVDTRIRTIGNIRQHCLLFFIVVSFIKAKRIDNKIILL